ncbi:MAG: hypothetical protein M1445_05720 [Bacteroidetes bacterium]|nr:hypothetical protein [Bacteroidota bacterium]
MEDLLEKLLEVVELGEVELKSLFRHNSKDKTVHWNLPSNQSKQESVHNKYLKMP